MRPRPSNDLAELLVESIDDVAAMLIARCEGLDGEEYLWEPVPDCWTVREVSPRSWRADWGEGEPQSPPVTTIAWRLFHIGVDCFESYSERAFGSTATGLEGHEWVGDPEEALRLTSAAVAHFTSSMSAVGSDGIYELIGPAFGPWANHSMVDLALHAQHELAHHGAEIGLLRDLYAAHETAR